MSRISRLTVCLLPCIPACAGLQERELLTLPKPTPKVEITEKAKKPPVMLAQHVEPKSNPSTFKLPSVPNAAEQGRPESITLPAALALVQANPLDIQIADEKVKASSEQLAKARSQWLPNLNLGADYFRHDGQIQDIVGVVFPTNRSTLLVGGGPSVQFSTSDAVFATLAAKQQYRATQADAQATRNDTTLSVALAYFNVQQARGEVAGAVEALQKADDLVNRTVKLAPELTPELEVNRAKAEAARRRQAVENAYERWQIASAELVRLLRLTPGTLVEPAEDPSLVVNLIDANSTLDELIAIGLTHRPELQSHQAIVQAALERVKQEKYRPFLPSLAVRGVGSNTPGLAGGAFGGGQNSYVGNFAPRFSVDLQAVWELQGLGFGNRANYREKQADSRRTLLELLKAQESITAEVTQAHAQLMRSSRRIAAAQEQVSNAAAAAEKNLTGLSQTKRSGDQLVLVFRPQEAVAAVAALEQAYRDYYQAIGDHNRAQFRLYRALGHPGHSLCNTETVVETKSDPTKPKPETPKVMPAKAVSVTAPK